MRRIPEQDRDQFRMVSLGEMIAIDSFGIRAQKSLGNNFIAVKVTRHWEYIG